MGMGEEDLIKNESMPILNNDIQDFNPNDITFPENLGEEWDKIKQDKEIVNKIEDLSKLLFSDYGVDEVQDNPLFDNNDSLSIDLEGLKDEKETDNNINENHENSINSKSNSEIQLLEALPKSTSDIKNDILLNSFSQAKNKENKDKTGNIINYNNKLIF